MIAGEPGRCAPAGLVCAVPDIVEGEDWRSRFTSAWVNVAEHQEGHEVEAISLAEPSPTTPTLCGYATVDGVRYEIHYSRSGRDTVRTEWDLLPTTSGVEYLPVRVEKRWIGGPCLYSIALAPVPAADEPRQRLAEGEHADDCDLTCTAEGQIPCWVYEIAPTEEADRG